MNITINQLVLAGGGFKGIAYIGMYKYLEETGHDKHIHTIAGTSIGAFIATLICMGYKSEELQSVILHFDYNKYHSIDLNHLFENFGLDSCQKITKFFELLFLTKKYAADITFSSLYEKTKVHLIMNAVCLNTHESVLFDYIKSPEMPVIKAILASMAMPFLFACINYNDLSYSDGGIINNFLIDLPQFIQQPHLTLGINLSQSFNYSVKSIDNIVSYSQQLLTCIHNVCQKVVTNKKTHPDMHIINLSSREFGTFDFNLTMPEKNKLIDIGYTKTKHYFEVEWPLNKAKMNSNQMISVKSLLNQLNQLLLNNSTKEALDLIDKYQSSLKREHPIKESKRKI